jgi:hypothetical protein
MGEIQNRCVFIFFGMTFFVTIQSDDWWCLQSVVPSFGHHNVIFLRLDGSKCVSYQTLF